jgi:hypothetical protein
MKPSPDLALAVMTAWQWRQYGLLPAKEGGGRKRARHRGQTTDAAWKQAVDRARPGDAASWATAGTRARPPFGMRPRCGWPGGMGRAAANGMGGVSGERLIGVSRGTGLRDAGSDGGDGGGGFGGCGDGGCDGGGGAVAVGRWLRQGLSRLGLWWRLLRLLLLLLLR